MPRHISNNEEHDNETVTGRCFLMVLALCVEMPVPSLDELLHGVVEGCRLKKPNKGIHERRFMMTVISFDAPAMVVISIQ